MGGSGSKATVLENMIKNFKDSMETMGGKMMPGQLRESFVKPNMLSGVDWPPEGTVSLNHKGSLCYSYGKSLTPQPVPVYRLGWE